jgi:two-component system, NarL family, response regulator NreC
MSSVVDRAHRPTRLLLVDDHPVLRAGIRTLLAEQPDLEVVAEAHDGPSAVELAHQLEVDVVIMDVSLPGLGGADATGQILRTDPSLKVLALSAHDEPEFARALLAAGAAGYALKRSAGDELVRAVRKVAAGGTYVDPSLAAALGDGSSAGRPVVPGVSLSHREAEVIRLIARGHTSKEMAESLGISPRTLETYKARAMAKLDLRTRADLIRYAMKAGWLREE